MTKRNKAVSEVLPPPVEVLPRHDPDLAKLIAQTVEQKIADAFASDDLFQPFFQPRAVGYEIKRKQTVPKQNKWTYYFEDYGCLICGTRKSHRCLGMCERCHERTNARLRRSLARRAPAPDEQDPTFMDTVKLAREALAPSVRALLDEPAQLTDSPRSRTQTQVAEEVGVKVSTISDWIKTGKLERPKKRMGPNSWLWGEEDVERVRKLVAASPRLQKRSK